MSSLMEKEIISIEDKWGFVYDVTLEHHFHHGFTNAMYDDDFIDQCCLNKCPQPRSDDDREWEWWQQRFEEWKDEMKVNLIPRCKEYFNSRSN